MLTRKWTFWLDAERAPIPAFAAALALFCGLALQARPRPASAAEVQSEQEFDCRFRAYRQVREQMNRRDLAELLANVRAWDGRIAVDAIDGDVLGLPNNTCPGFVGPVEQVVPPFDAAAAFARFDLQGAVIGDPSLAMINNQVARVGTQVRALTVLDIQADRVILGYKDQKYELKRKDPDAGGTPPKPRPKPL